MRRERCCRPTRKRVISHQVLHAVHCQHGELIAACSTCRSIARGKAQSGMTTLVYLHTRIRPLYRYEVQRTTLEVTAAAHIVCYIADCSMHRVHVRSGKALLRDHQWDHLCDHMLQRFDGASIGETRLSARLYGAVQQLTLHCITTVASSRRNPYIGRTGCFKHILPRLACCRRYMYTRRRAA
eukprot:9337-Heterococcus_DN1.PRE.4